MGLHIETSRRIEPNAGDAGSDAERSGPRDDATAGELDRARDHVAALESTLATQARAHADLIHLLSHELRTPITIIAGFSRLLLDPGQGDLSDQQLGFVEESLKACRRLDLLVTDLLEASPESGSPLQVNPEPGDLDVTIASTLDSLAPLLVERKMRVEWELGASAPPVEFDAARIEQVVTNLATNAIRYGAAGGTIRVGRRSTAIDGRRYVEVHVEDDGPGIPEIDRKRVFEPYVRGAGHSSCAGMGIGLAICHRIITAHSGSIRVEEGRTGGARFVFTLPAAPGVAQE